MKDPTVPIGVFFSWLFRFKKYPSVKNKPLYITCIVLYKAPAKNYGQIQFILHDRFVTIECAAIKNLLQ